MFLSLITSLLFVITLFVKSSSSGFQIYPIHKSPSHLTASGFQFHSTINHKSPSHLSFSTKTITTMSESSPIAKDMPTMTEIKRYLLPDPNLNQSSVFDVDSQKGLSFFLFDLVVCTASLTSLTFIATNLSFQSLNLPFQFLSIFPLELFTGTALWAMWCIGHDAGHGLINRPKKNNKVNDIVGEVAHSIFCLTPFAPWRRSHKLHHLHHNHVTDDFSHQWFIREDGLPDWIKNAYLLRNLQLPFLYLTYLAIGIPDGSHFFFYPGCGGRMWEKAGEREVSERSERALLKTFKLSPLNSRCGGAQYLAQQLLPLLSPRSLFSARWRGFRWCSCRI